MTCTEHLPVAISITICYVHLEKAGKEESLWFLLIAIVSLVFNFAEFIAGYTLKNTY